MTNPPQSKERALLSQAANPLSAEDLSALRGGARRRSLVLPGAGWWELGYTARGWLSFAVAAATVVCFVTFALFTCAVSFWALVVCIGLYLIVNGIEYVAVRRVAPRPAEPAPRRFRLAVLALVAGIAAGVAAMLRYDGLLIMRGTAMFPTVRESDSLYFSRFWPRGNLRRGTAIAYQPSDLGHGDVAVARVLALPGDTISVHAGSYWVNGTETPALPGQRAGQRVKVAVPFHPETIDVPEGMVFVVADNSSEGFDSQVLGWIAQEQILSSRLLLFGGRRWGRGIDRAW